MDVGSHKGDFCLFPNGISYTVSGPLKRQELIDVAGFRMPAEQSAKDCLVGAVRFSGQAQGPYR